MAHETLKIPEQITKRPVKIMNIVREYDSKDGLDMVELFYADHGKSYNHALRDAFLELKKEKRKQIPVIEVIQMLHGICSKHGAALTPPKI